MLTKLHPLQVENQLENNNTIWRMSYYNACIMLSDEVLFPLF